MIMKKMFANWFAPAAMVALAATVNLAAAGTPGTNEMQGQENATLGIAPNVPPPITRKYATKVVVNLEVREVTKRLADGVDYVFWTFGGDVPGHFIRVREGDEVEFHLHNHQDNKMPHNIDLHAVAGPGGGATSSFTAPGHSSQFSFQAINPGLFVYHCATAPVGMHIANGMYGLILVEPREGLPPVDHEYYVMQGEFYTPGKFGDGGLQTFDLDKALDERPSYVLFNGAVGSLSGDHALTAKVGETVRIYFGVGGPNLSSAFHVIGAQFDTVYQDGEMSNQLHGVQTLLVPPGSAIIVDLKMRVPGTYTLVDHSIFRAFNKGATGSLIVTGNDNPLVYSGKQADLPYSGAPIKNEVHVASNAQIQSLREFLSGPDSKQPADPALAAQMQRGRAVYMQTCFVCHLPNGEGVFGQIPPLARSDFLSRMGTDDYIRGVLLGRTGKIVVNGKTYNGTMIPFTSLTDDQLADVLTYVRNSFDNKGKAVTPGEVNRIRHVAPVVAKNQYE